MSETFVKKEEEKKKKEGERKEANPFAPKGQEAPKEKEEIGGHKKTKLDRRAAACLFEDLRDDGFAEEIMRDTKSLEKRARDDYEKDVEEAKGKTEVGVKGKKKDRGGKKRVKKRD